MSALLQFLSFALEKLCPISSGDEILKLQNCFSIVADNEDNLGLKLLQPPPSLQFDELHLDGGCLAIDITADGHLMCRTSDAMKVMNRDPLNIISSVNNTDAELWLQIIQAEGVAVGSCYNKEKKSPEVVLLDPKSLQKSRSIYKTTVDKFTYYKIAQHLSTVYILNSEEKQLVACNLVDNEIQELPVPEMNNPRNLCILPDSTILLADKTQLMVE